MSKTVNHTTDYVPFFGGMGMIGIDTNGAPPQAVSGFWVAAEIDEDKNGIHERYWLILGAEPTNNPNEIAVFEDHLLVDSDLRQIEQFIGALVSASFVEDWTKVLDGKFSGFMNKNQVEYAESGTATHECWDGLTCKVRSTGNGGFTAVLSKDSDNVASLRATFHGEQVKRALNVLKDPRSWRKENLRTLKVASSDTCHEDDANPAPGI